MKWKNVAGVKNELSQLNTSVEVSTQQREKQQLGKMLSKCQL